MSQLYIRVMTGFYSHRKTAKLKTLIGDDAFWIPPRLWAYAAENQPDGNFLKYSSDELSIVLGCVKHCSSIAQALKDCGFIDDNGAIHNWKLHAKYHNAFSQRAKAAANARWEADRERKKSPQYPLKKEDKDSGHRTVDSGASIALASPQQCSSIPKHEKEGGKGSVEIYSAHSRTALHWLNEKSGKRFRELESSLAPINARLKESGVDIEGVKKMIERQCDLWGKDPKMSEHLTPSTLFRPENFNNYYAAKDLPIQTGEKPKVKTIFDKEMDRIKSL